MAAGNRYILPEYFHSAQWGNWYYRSGHGACHRNSDRGSSDSCRYRLFLRGATMGRDYSECRRCCNRTYRYDHAVQPCTTGKTGKKITGHASTSGAAGTGELRPDDLSWQRWEERLIPGNKPGAMTVSRRCTKTAGRDCHLRYKIKHFTSRLDIQNT